MWGSRRLTTLWDPRPVTGIALLYIFTFISTSLSCFLTILSHFSSYSVIYAYILIFCDCSQFLQPTPYYIRTVIPKSLVKNPVPPNHYLAHLSMWSQPSSPVHTGQIPCSLLPHNSTSVSKLHDTIPLLTSHVHTTFTIVTTLTRNTVRAPYQPNFRHITYMTCDIGLLLFILCDSMSTRYDLLLNFYWGIWNKTGSSTINSKIPQLVCLKRYNVV
jgi:hypothetical protein